jgi:ribosomal protein L37AE/L43A
MPEVTCPECQTRQAIDPTAAGYACTRCGAEWDFVTCGSCGGRFHARPDAATWECPTCGSENVRPHARSAAPTPGRGLLVAIGGVVVIALLAFVLTRGGDDEVGEAPRSPATPAGTARAQLCANLVDLQTLRFEALGRTADTLEGDAEALRAEGDETLADDVNVLVQAVRDLSDAYNTPGEADNEAATDAVLDALGPIPC